MSTQVAWGVIGHEWAADLLAQRIAADRLPHSILFTGPPGIGKTTIIGKVVEALLPRFEPVGHGLAELTASGIEEFQELIDPQRPGLQF